MLRLLADENFNGDIVRGLRLRKPDLDIVRVQDVGLAAVEDPVTCFMFFGQSSGLFWRVPGEPADVEAAV